MLQVTIIPTEGLNNVCAVQINKALNGNETRKVSVVLIRVLARMNYTIHTKYIKK